MFSQHHRFAIWSSAQHPYKHSLNEFVFSNPSLPGVTNIESALNYIIAVLYPQTKEAVATVADLPAVGNTLNDFRVVQDDGDGNAAGYRWEQREGEVSASWHKIYDMDWGIDSILTQFNQQAQALYLVKDGNDDLDSTGAVITGTLAGQRVFGGKSANTNLTLSANSGDGTGSQTGYVQVTDNFRPTSNNALDVGTASEKFKNFYLAGTANISTMAVTGGSITDSSGAISFGDENLTTTGNVTGAVVKGTTSLVAEVGGQTMTLVPGTITSSTGAISFDNENLSTTGTLASGTLTVSSDMVIATGSITSVSGAISFGNENLTTTGTLNAGITVLDRLTVDNIRIDGGVITTLSGDLNFTSFTGAVVVNATFYGTTSEFTGAVKAGTYFEASDLVMNGSTSTISTYSNNIIISPATNILAVNALLRPTSDNARDLGTSLLRWRTLYVGTSIHNGTNAITVADLLALRDVNYRDAARTQPAQTGDSLFYDSVTGTWRASAPDSEIAHATLSGLTTSDAGHTQFAMLAGRSGGQTLQGGTAGGEHLLLESTANASKGLIKVKDSLVPNTNASYSGGWSGTDLGGTSNYFNNIYLKGELKNARLENIATASLPGFSAQTPGRMIFDTTALLIKYDTGAAIKTLLSTDDTQNVSGKTFAQSILFGTDNTYDIGATGTNVKDIHTSGFIGFGELSTPSTPSSGRYRVYFKSDGKPYYLNSAGTETQVGSGSGSGGINYMSSNPDAESNTTGWTSYDDSAATPIDLTGGTFTGFTRSTSSPIRGSASFLFTPSAAGKGAQFTITPDRADILNGSVLEISFDYEVTTANIAEGDYTVWVYDVANSTLIQPTPYKIPSAVSGRAYKWKGAFQLSTTGTTFRIGIHQAASTSGALKLDNFVCGPQVKTYGPYISDWTSWTPTGSWTLNSPTYTGRWRTVGDTREYNVRILCNGNVDNAALTINLPSGHTIDTAKTLTVGSHMKYGQATFLDAGTAVFHGYVCHSSTTAVEVRAYGAAGTYVNTNVLSNSVTQTWVSTDEVIVSWSVPIVGLSSSMLLSSDADTRVVAARYKLTASSTNTSFADNVSEVVDYDTKDFDTHNAVTTGLSWKFTAPVPGIYVVNANLIWANTTNLSSFELALRKNGSVVAWLDTEYTANFARDMQGTTTISLVAGDYIDVVAYQDDTTSAARSITTTANLSYIDIYRLSGPSQIAASETIACSYSTAAGQSISNGATAIIDFGTKDYDTHGAVTTGAAWKFTAPAAGIYRVAVAAWYAAANFTAGNNMSLGVYVDGGLTKRPAYYVLPANLTATAPPLLVGAVDVKVLAGQTIDVRTAHGESAARALQGNSSLNWITISRVGIA